MQMKPVPEGWESLRLAAKAADREKTGEMLRPEFERRLMELGYGPRAVAHAFSILTGPGTVAEALAELARAERADRARALPLFFETVEDQPALPAGHSLTITGVEREPYSIRISYAVHPPLPPDAGGPHTEARDESGHTYDPLGGGLALAHPVDHTKGFLTLHLPPPNASVLHVRMSWSQEAQPLSERPAYELRITLQAAVSIDTDQ